jgi:hypothetical protein
VTNLLIAVIVGCSMADCLPDPRAAACNAAKQSQLNAQTRRKVALLAHNAAAMQWLKAHSFFMARLTSKQA